MKKLLLFLCSGIILSGCADKKAQENAVRDSVLAMHEKVMDADGKLEDNKTALDTFIKKTPGGALSDSARFYANKLSLADSAMMTWMHGFSPDLTKSHDENMAYMRKQKKLIMQLDSQMNAAVAASGKFISKTKTK